MVSASDERISEEYPLGSRLLLHGLGVEEPAAVAGLPPLLRAHEPRQEPPDLLLLAGLLLLHLTLIPLRRRFPPRRLCLPPRGLLPDRGRHQRLREGRGVDEGGAVGGRPAEDVDRGDVRRERGVVGRRGRAPGGVGRRRRRRGGGARGGCRRGGGGEVREAVAEAGGADALGHPVLRVPLAPVLPLRPPHDG